jgi:hypothetical protein
MHLRSVPPLPLHPPLPQQARSPQHHRDCELWLDSSVCGKKEKEKEKEKGKERAGKFTEGQYKFVEM